MGPLARKRPGDWDEVFRAAPTGALWRRHSDAVNRRLVRHWLAGRQLRRVLKTDLWDEAVADGVAPALADHADEVHGVDVAPLTVAAAARRHPWLRTAEADVRSVPAGDGAYDGILSLSTLDHLPGRPEVEDGLWELRRVLRRGGELLITFDNRANPVVALRNALPARARRATGLVPYPGGGRPRETGALAAHRARGVRRAPQLGRTALPSGDRRSGRGAAEARGERAAERLAGRLMAWERLSELPTRQITGHFVVVQARRR